ncbi:uncharacterized protein LOC122624974 [Drosophila teissieri]|uniref:uncharacterized protein LOC122624974 n=1 Tax=Drosophila teissieri TaxID=7243 RepID=UPI001CBA3F4F|nr:uncharacterized protein LOC122624974 [Drosophila teissieri]
MERSLEQRYATAFVVTNFLTQKKISVVPQPPYSPDLAPCDFFLFPLLKRELKGKHWESVENIQARVTRFLKGISVEEFQGEVIPLYWIDATVVEGNKKISIPAPRMASTVIQELMKSTDH